MMEQETIPVKRCSMCHDDLPITDFYYHKRGKYNRTSQCKECLRKYKHLDHVKLTTQKYKEANQDRIRANAKEHYKRHLEEKTLYFRLYRAEHKAEKKLQNKAYRTEHRERIQAYRNSLKAKASIRIGKMRYRARLTQAKGDFTKEQFQARCEYYGWQCYLCKKPLTLETVIIEHRIPLSREGSNWPANLAPSCRSCNSRKHNKTEKEYRLELSKVEEAMAV